MQYEIRKKHVSHKQQHYLSAESNLTKPKQPTKRQQWLSWLLVQLQNTSLQDIVNFLLYSKKMK